MISITLVLVLSWSLGSGFPVRKQNDLLTGPDFLEVFMRGRLPPSEASTDHYFGNDVYGKAEAGQGAQEFRPEESKGYEVEEEPVETTTMMESTTGGEQTTTTEGEVTEPPSQVVSVRVSSSVVRSKPETVLSTQDQPTLTAVQRSHFGVEESSSSLSYSPPAEPPQERVSYSEEHTVLRVEGRQSKYRRVPDSYAEASQQYGTRAAPEEEKKEEARVEAIAQAPISYQTSVSSATSGSRVHFYREPPRPAPPPPPPPPPKTNYELPERVYGRPEANYEVEEAVSVVSNGRAHGVQEKPREPDPKHKFGYVVEGRNFRKYRVEERTADGFIVGEYGVVSHDDGSLRGVRYTADSTINPRLIYDALVKFLSLK